MKLSEPKGRSVGGAASGALSRIALIGSCVPRQCGIATFTEDLRSALTEGQPDLSTLTVAVTDPSGEYTYPDLVPLEIRQEDPESYRIAADFLNMANVDVVSLQHEFGIYGGPAGEHLLHSLRHLKVPVVTTLHTVLTEPSDDQRRVMTEIIRRSARLIVMAEKGRDILQDAYGVAPDRIEVVPHGVPDRPFIDPAMAKHDLGLANRTILMTFGHLGPGKGIETAIRALPELVRDDPAILYMIVGATHPNLRHHEGEVYRESLTSLAAELGVSNNIRFINCYLPFAELLRYLSSCDIYVAPYPNEAQITSGTLAYAVALGKAVISTSFWHAQELLADKCGLLVPFAEPDALAHAIRSLLNDAELRSEVRTSAYARGRGMIWRAVAARYSDIFREVRSARPAPQTQVIPFIPPATKRRDLPPLTTDRLSAMTDGVGLIQHAQFSVPDRSNGYCLDDNARALLLMSEIGRIRPLTRDERRLQLTYCAFVDHALMGKTRPVHNFMGFNREWIDEAGTDDAHGRAVWALGAVARREDCGQLDEWASARLLELAPRLLQLSSPRAWAYGLLGIVEFLGRFPDHLGFRRLQAELSARLMERWKDAATADWNWFEDRLAYDNALLCEALIVTGHAQADPSLVDAGLDTLRWLMKLQTAQEGHFRPIGTDTFGADRKLPEPFDQQPLEAASAVTACLTAAEITGDLRWHEEARRAFDWFLGANDLCITLVDEASGACFDGLHPDRRNANQGAESTLAYLAALARLHLARAHRTDLAECCERQTTVAAHMR